MANAEDLTKAQGREIESFVYELSVMKQMIQEEKQPLDLVRELLSNACAREVGATEEDLAILLNQLLYRPLNGVGQFQDRGLIAGAEVVEVEAEK